MNTPATECQAFGCDLNAVDDMGLFCDRHWDMIPADARAFLRNLHSSDQSSQDHKRWQREVRKTIAMMMGKELELSRNKDRKNLDEFDKPDPFIAEGKAEGVAAQRGKVLGESSDIKPDEQDASP